MPHTKTKIEELSLKEEEHATVCFRDPLNLSGLGDLVECSAGHLFTRAWLLANDMQVQDEMW